MAYMDKDQFDKMKAKAKLTDEQRSEIRRSIEPTKVLAERYNVTRAAITRVRPGFKAK